MKKADILAASEKLEVAVCEIIGAIFDELWSELSQENITLERAREIFEIGRLRACDAGDKLVAGAISREVGIIISKLNAATTLKDLRAVEKECAAAIENELRGLEKAQVIWEVGSRRWNEIAIKLLEEPGATIESLMNLWGELSFPRYSTTAARSTIESKINELLQAELACPGISFAKARDIYDISFSNYETKKMAVKVLLRLLPS